MSDNSNSSKDLLPSVRRMNLVDSEKLAIEAQGDTVDAEGNVHAQLKLSLRDRFNSWLNKDADKVEDPAKRQTLKTGAVAAAGVGLAPALKAQDILTELSRQPSLEFAESVQRLLESDFSPSTLGELISTSLEDHFGIPKEAEVTTISRYFPGYDTPLPQYNVAHQTKWWQSEDFRQSCCETINVSDIIGNDFSDLHPGRILYLQTAENSNGYNEYDQGCVVVRNSDGSLGAVTFLDGTVQTIPLAEYFSRIYGESVDTTAADTSGNTELQLKANIVNPVGYDALRKRNRHFMPVTAPTEQKTSEQLSVSPPKRLLFYGNLRAWGGLSRRGTEVHTTPAQVVDDLFESYLQSRTQFELSEHTRCHADLIFIDENGSYILQTNEVVEEIFRRSETNHIRTDVSLNFRVPTNWTSNDVIREILYIYSGDHPQFDMDFLKTHAFTISLDFELPFIAGHAPTAEDIVHINRVYLAQQRKFDGQREIDGLHDAFWNTKPPELMIYEMGFGINSFMIRDPSSIDSNVSVMNMSIGNPIQKLDSNDTLRETYNRTIGCMLFTSDQLIHDQRDGGDFIEEDANHPNGVINQNTVNDFVSASGADTIAFQ